VRQTTRLPSEIIFAVLPSSPPSCPMSLSKLVYETSSEPMTSPSRSSTIPRYSDEACLCVLQIWGETLRFRKVRSTSLKMHAAFFYYTFTIFFFYLCAKVCQLRLDLCRKRRSLTLISNAFFRTCMHEALKTVQSFKSERYRKIYNVIRVRRSRDGSLTATLYIRVINTYAPYNNDFSHGGQTIKWMSCSVTKRDYVKTIWVERPPNCKAAVLGLSNAL